MADNMTMFASKNAMEYWTEPALKDYKELFQWDVGRRRNLNFNTKHNFNFNTKHNFNTWRNTIGTARQVAETCRLELNLMKVIKRILYGQPNWEGVLKKQEQYSKYIERSI
tara:strand:+ start:105 stop:437 length:333 start_codon:yes stop_codon:yes gene_type:complete